MRSSRIEEFLSGLRKRRVLFAGLGNPLRSDDTAGLLIIDRIPEFPLSENWTAVKCYQAPENYLDVLSRGEHDVIVFIDTVQGIEKDYRIYEKEEIRDFSFSTHSFGLASIISFLNRKRRFEIYLVGLKPTVLSLGTTLSPEMERIVETIVRGFERECEK